MEKIKLLMVDDNINLVGMVKEYFSNHELIELVYSANDGLEGIELIEKEQNNFDVLILDLIMPNKDGMYVLSEMKKRGINKKAESAKESTSTTRTITSTMPMIAKSAAVSSCRAWAWRCAARRWAGASSCSFNTCLPR